jgi:hypothetical protein
MSGRWVKSVESHSSSSKKQSRPKAALTDTQTSLLSPTCAAASTLRETDFNRQRRIQTKYYSIGRYRPINYAYSYSRIGSLRDIGLYPHPFQTIVDFGLSKLDDVTERVNITLPRRVLHAIDEAARRAGETRSGFIARAGVEAARTVR